MSAQIPSTLDQDTQGKDQLNGGDVEPPKFSLMVNPDVKLADEKGAIIIKLKEFSIGLINQETEQSAEDKNDSYPVTIQRVGINPEKQLVQIKLDIGVIRSESQEVSGYNIEQEVDLEKKPKSNVSTLNVNSNVESKRAQDTRLNSPKSLEN